MKLNFQLQSLRSVSRRYLMIISSVYTLEQHPPKSIKTAQTSSNIFFVFQQSFLPMASPSPFLSVVLDRLKRENLHGPISPFSQEYRQKKQQQQQQDDWQFVSAASAHGGEEGIDDDLDAKDPR